MSSIPDPRRTTAVLFCNHQSSRHFVGGAEFVLLNIARSIDRNAFSPYFLSNREGLVTRCATEAGIRSQVMDHDLFGGFLFPKQGVKKSLDDFITAQDRNIQRIVDHIVSHHIHVVVVNTIINIVPLIAAKRAGVPAIWLIHEILFPFHCIQSRWKRLACIIRHPFEKSTRRKGLEVLKQTIVQYSHRAFILSDRARASILAPHEFSDRVLTMYPPLRKEIFDAAAKEAPAGKEKKCSLLHVGFLGILVKHKGVHDFIEAAGRVARKNANIRFMIAGGSDDSAYEQSLRRRAERLGLNDRLVFHGFVPDPVPIYQMADIVCLTSLYDEPFGMVVSEGMAFGKTVVAYDTGSIREIIADGETGFIVPRGDTEALAGKIDFLERNRDVLKRIGENARRAALAKYDPSRYVRRLETLLNEINHDG